MDDTIEILIRKVTKLENEIVKLNARISAIEAQHQTYGGNYNYNKSESDFLKNNGWDSHIAPCPCDSERDW